MNTQNDILTGFATVEMSTSSDPEVEAKLDVPFAIISDLPYKIWQTK